MRMLVLGSCLLAAGCNGGQVRSPTSPSNGISSTSPSAVTAGSSQTQATSGTNLPFKGSLVAEEKNVVTPPNLLVDGTAEGTATHLGRYTATFKVVVTLATGTATGTYVFTAANGDTLVATFTGVGVPAGPEVADITENATVTGGTGRFATASGTFTIRRVLQQATGGSTGSIEGRISLNH